MVNVFMMGGAPAPGASSTGSGIESWIEKLLPVAVIAVIGYLIYRTLFGSTTEGATTTTTTAPTTPTVYTPTTPTTAQPGQGVKLSDLVNTPTGAAAARTQATQGGYIVNAPSTYGNIPVDIVVGGKGSPQGYYPIVGGAGLSISEAVTPQVAAQQVTAIVQGQGQDFDYLRLQWGITPVVQSPSLYGGAKHCTCTPALKASGVCGANDDWYNC